MDVIISRFGISESNQKKKKKTTLIVVHILDIVHILKYCPSHPGM